MKTVPSHLIACPKTGLEQVGANPHTKSTFAAALRQTLRAARLPQQQLALSSQSQCTDHLGYVAILANNRGGS